jgi:hypothetical protein
LDKAFGRFDFADRDGVDPDDVGRFGDVETEAVFGKFSSEEGV